MKRFAGLLLLVIILFSMSVYGEDTPLYLDAKASPEQRTEDLLARMTLPEKVGQLMQVDLGGLRNGQDVDGLNKVILNYGVGAILSGGGGAPVNNRPEGWAVAINNIQSIALKTRLKIPVLYGVDAVHGHNNVMGATIYPYNLGLAATFNPEIAKTYTAMTAVEIAATGIHWTFAPVLDVASDPRWGRTFETFGEDPYLVSAMGSSQIQGFQASGKILACAKHFIAYSAPNNGMDRTPADLSERKLREIYLPPFKAAVKAGVGTFMINSGEVNGVPAHASKWLLQELLRKELGFKGLVDSDYLDINKVYNYHNAAANLEEAVARCFNAGIDMTMLQDPRNLQQADILVKLVEQGVVPIARVDDAVRKVLIIKFKLGLFEHRLVDPAVAQKLVGSEASRNLARTIADQSIVLLKNKSEILPLAKSVKNILVTGPSADSRSRMCGGWTIHWLGAGENELTTGDTVLQGIKKKVAVGTNVRYIPNLANEAAIPKGDADEAIKEADVVVMVVGEKPYSEMFGDSQELILSKDQENLVQRLNDSGKPVILVVIAGRPLILPPTQNISAILWAFLPGTEGGGAIADVIFGDYNPSGRLPITIPKRVGQLPMAYNCRRTEKYDPMYGFGYGLSYTTFTYSNLTVPEKVKVGENVKVSVTVKNTGKVAGTDSVLLFVRDEYATVTLPVRTLQGFARVSLAPGEEKVVNFELTPEQLSILDENLKQVEEPGDFKIMVGNASAKMTVLQ